MSTISSAGQVVLGRVTRSWNGGQLTVEGEREEGQREDVFVALGLVIVGLGFSRSWLGLIISLGFLLGAVQSSLGYSWVADTARLTNGVSIYIFSAAPLLTVSTCS